MNSKILYPLAALSSIAFLACRPYPEPQLKKQTQKPVAQTTPAQNQEKIRQQRAQLKEREQASADNDVGNNVQNSPRDNTESITAPKSETPHKKEYSYATPVPGKPGFVLSPYNNKVIDVTGMPKGQLVSDPTYPKSEQKYFRVP